MKDVVIDDKVNYIKRSPCLVVKEMKAVVTEKKIER